MNGRTPDIDPARRRNGGDASPQMRLDEAALEGLSVGTLLRRLAADVPALVVKEVALAKIELADGLQATRRGMLALFTGAIVLIPGVLMLLVAGMYALSLMLEFPLWMAASIIGGGVSLLGLVLLLLGRRQLDPARLRPDRALEQWRRDADLMHGGSHERTTH